MRMRTLALTGAAVLAAALGAAAPASAVTIGAAAQGASGGGTGLSVAVSPKSLDFGSQEIGTTSAPQVLTVTNTGSAPVEIGLLLLLDAGGCKQGEYCAPFAEYNEQPGVDDTGAGCSLVFLAPGASCSVSFTFSPTELGAQPAVADVEAAANTTEPFQVPAAAPLTGKGTSPGAFVGSITLPAAVAQNGVTGGQPVTATVNLSKTPGGPCATFKEPITVALSTNFSPNPPASVPSQVVVPAGQCSANFTVTTAPTTVQEQTSIIGTVTSDPNANFDERGVSLTINP